MDLMNFNNLWKGTQFSATHELAGTSLHFKPTLRLLGATATRNVGLFDILTNGTKLYLYEISVHSVPKLLCRKAQFLNKRRQNVL